MAGSFTREFEHASVWVNTESREAKITWEIVWVGENDVLYAI